MRKSNSVAVGGITTALTLVVLSLGLFLNFNELFFLFLSSCCGITAVILADKKTAFISYISVCILASLFLSAHLGMLILYILVFGLYPFVKLYLEKCNNPPIEFLLKLLFLNSGILITFFIYDKLFANIFAFKFSVWIAIIVLQIGYIIYDYALTTFVVFINSKTKRIKRRK